MKGIKLGLLGITLGLLGVSFGTNHIIAIALAAVGVLTALVGCFVN